MKRSEINVALKELEAMCEQIGFALPPFAHILPEEWESLDAAYDEIRDNMLGWDITDYGLGRFDEVGFSLFTLRNGKLGDARYPKPYAEKLLYLRDGQTAPMHFHWYKTEDIINRGGGEVHITVYPQDGQEGLGDGPVAVSCDGHRREVPAGTAIVLKPGESITIPAGLYHDFIVPKGKGPVLLGEVSMCNDDENDNRFLEPIGRFPEIVEDEPPYRLLCNEYPRAKEGR